MVITLLGRAHPGRGRPGRPASRRPGRTPERPLGAGDRARAAGGGRVRGARVAGAAAALPDRRPGGRRLPAPAPVHGHHRLPRRGHGGVEGRAPRRARQRVRDVEDGYGFLIEGVQYTTAISGSALPFTIAAAHKELMSRSATARPSSRLLRDRGHGRVTIDTRAWPFPRTRSPTSSTSATRRGHRGAGASARGRRRAADHRRSAPGLPSWRWGDDLDAFIARAQRLPLRAGGWQLFAAHQMGTCRMGTDPQRASPIRGASYTTRRACGSATAARSRPPRAPIL